MIGSLLYLTASLPYIMFILCKCARFQAAPMDFHLTVGKIIICYLIGTTKMSLWYTHFSHIELIGYSFADFEGDKNNRKSTRDTW